MISAPGYRANQDAVQRTLTFFAQFLAQRQVARFDNRGDLTGQIRADAGKLSELFRCLSHDAGNRLGQIANDTRRVSVSANTKGILPFELQQVGDFVEDLSDFGVFHDTTLAIQRAAARVADSAATSVNAARLPHPRSSVRPQFSLCRQPVVKRCALGTTVTLPNLVGTHGDRFVGGRRGTGRGSGRRKWLRVISLVVCMGLIGARF